MKKHLAISGIIALAIFSFSFSAGASANPYWTRKSKVVVYSPRHHRRHVQVSRHWEESCGLQQYVRIPEYRKHRKKHRPSIRLFWHW
ncbi:MAG: hypothetical protein NG737_00755 [Omnitrophica bacterium]|nr:hypothetical protein [Candidatus Omnitrophota bacterium]